MRKNEYFCKILMGKKQLIADIDSNFKRVEAVINNAHYKTACNIINKLYNQSLEINYQKGVNNYFEYQSLISYNTQDNESTINFTTHLIRIYKKKKNKKKLAQLYQILGVTYSRLNDFSLSSYLLKKSLKFNLKVEPLNNDSIAKNYTSLAFNAMNAEKYEKAHSYILAGLECLKNNNKEPGYTELYLAIYQVKILLKKGEIRKAKNIFTLLKKNKKTKNKKERAYVNELKINFLIEDNSPSITAFSALSALVIKQSIDLNDLSLRIRVLMLSKDFYKKHKKMTLAFKAANQIIKLNIKKNRLFNSVTKKNNIKFLKNKKGEKFEIYLKSDLDVAAKYQANFFINKIKSEKIKIDVLYKPSNTLSGDYIGAFNLSNEDNHYLFVLADVVGKGITASYISFMLEGIIKSIIYNSDFFNLKSIITDINTILSQTLNNNGFVSLWAGFLDLNKQTLESINAGHLPTFFLDENKKIHKLNEGPTILGMFSELPPFKSETISFNKGSSLIAYSDGITEAMNNNGDLYEVNFHKLIEKYNTNTNLNFINELKNELKEFQDFNQAQDDVSCLLINFKN